MTTGRVYASYQEIIDLNTESKRVSILGFHTPCNDQPIRLLKPFWTAYQKVKYLGCSMSLVPAARLPADPMGVSYEGGELQIDPRDLLNPILFHGCHGNDMGTILNQFYSGENGTGTVEVERKFSDSMDLNQIKTTYEGNTPIYETLYYRALTDNTWLKAHPMRGFRKSMRPLVYSLATNTPMNPNDGGITLRGGLVAKEQAWDAYDGVDEGDRNVGGMSVLGSGTTTNSAFQSSPAPGLQSTNITLNSETGKWSANWQNPGTYSGQFFMSPRLMRLGWIDTRQWVTGGGTSAALVNQTASPSDATFAEKLAGIYLSDDSRFCTIPKLFMGMCLLPPAYKTEQYFRIILNHKFAFAKYRGTSMRDNGQFYASIGNVVNMYSAASSGSKKDEVVSDGEPGDKGVLDD